jgi:hypothetical protein
MPARTGETLALKGMQQFLAANRAAPRNVRKATTEVFRRVGDSVKAGAAARMLPIDARSAAGYRTVVRQRGITVEQSLRKTTGKHPEFGALQMTRALLPSLAANEEQTMQALDRALDEVCDIYERIPPGP